MRDGFYWVKCKMPMDGITAGIALVRDDIAHIHGWALKVSAFEFGDDPQPLDVPIWMVKHEQNN